MKKSVIVLLLLIVTVNAKAYEKRIINEMCVGYDFDIAALYNGKFKETKDSIYYSYEKKIYKSENRDKSRIKVWYEPRQSRYGMLPYGTVTLMFFVDGELYVHKYYNAVMVFNIKDFDPTMITIKDNQSGVDLANVLLVNYKS